MTKEANVERTRWKPSAASAVTHQQGNIKAEGTRVLQHVSHDWEKPLAWSHARY